MNDLYVNSAPAGRPRIVRDQPPRMRAPMWVRSMTLLSVGAGGRLDGPREGDVEVVEYAQRVLASTVPVSVQGQFVGGDRGELPHSAP